MLCHCSYVLPLPAPVSRDTSGRRWVAPGGAAGIVHLFGLRNTGWIFEPQHIGNTFQKGDSPLFLQAPKSLFGVLLFTCRWMMRASILIYVLEMIIAQVRHCHTLNIEKNEWLFTIDVF